MERSDNELLQSHLDGDPKAFEIIISRYIKLVYSLTLRLAGNRDDAQDIVQETFLKLWKNAKKFDEKKNFKAWLMKIGRNTTIDFLRKRKDKAFSEFDLEKDGESYEEKLEDGEPLPDEILERAELAKTLEEALNHLSLGQKTIVLLKHEQDMTFEEIAEVFEKPMNTIKSQYRRALIVLRSYLNNAPK